VGKEITDLDLAEAEVRHGRMPIGDERCQHVGICREPLGERAKYWHIGERGGGTCRRCNEVTGRGRTPCRGDRLAISGIAPREGRAAALKVRSCDGSKDT